MVLWPVLVSLVPECLLPGQMPLSSIVLRDGAWIVYGAISDPNQQQADSAPAGDVRFTQVEKASTVAIPQQEESVTQQERFETHYRFHLFAERDLYRREHWYKRVCSTISFQFKGFWIVGKLLKAF